MSKKSLIGLLIIILLLCCAILLCLGGILTLNQYSKGHEVCSVELEDNLKMHVQYKPDIIDSGEIQTIQVSFNDGEWTTIYLTAEMQEIRKDLGIETDNYKDKNPEICSKLQDEIHYEIDGNRLWINGKRVD